jgi:hypothetical protein
VAHTCKSNLSTLEAEAGKFQVQGQPGLLSKTLTRKKRTQEKIKEGRRKEKGKEKRCGGTYHV